MSKLNALNGWKASKEFNAKRNAQNYLNKEENGYRFFLWVKLWSWRRWRQK